MGSHFTQAHETICRADMQAAEEVVLLRFRTTVSYAPTNAADFGVNITEQNPIITVARLKKHYPRDESVLSA
jgi:hypothetical protein